MTMTRRIRCVMSDEGLNEGDESRGAKGTDGDMCVDVT